MIGAKAARILTYYAYKRDATKEEAIEWLETNFDFKIRQAAARGDSNLIFFVPKPYLSYVNDYLVNSLGYQFQALGREPRNETLIKVKIYW